MDKAFLQDLPCSRVRLWSELHGELLAPAHIILFRQIPVRLGPGLPLLLRRDRPGETDERFVDAFGDPLRIASLSALLPSNCSDHTCSDVCVWDSVATTLKTSLDRRTLPLST